ncbi:DDE-type integrase/transposase/recombinase [Nocardioides vastitatis]|uniref:DDE-type integrase/transposase/recombinase n=1 Tax=Nocardioides vastitatis TaxID=2568655 RepID=A0ABW0ZE81_9ACTN|nr:hypothetical protein E7Z54_08580 [Nocardioides sp.]
MRPSRPTWSSAPLSRAPRRLWVADITYVATWSGFAYVAFVTDVYSRRIAGRNVAATLKADILTLQALDMAAWDARREGAVDLTGLVHHADHGSNYLSIVYTDRIGELGAKPRSRSRPRTTLPKNHRSQHSLAKGTHRSENPVRFTQGLPRNVAVRAASSGSLWSSASPAPPPTPRSYRHTDRGSSTTTPTPPGRRPATT